MTALESGLRELIAEIVRDEVKRALAEVTAPDEFLSTSQAAKVAGISTRSIARWIRQGRLTEHRAGRLVRVLRAELDALLRASRRDRDESPEALAQRDFGNRR